MNDVPTRMGALALALMLAVPVWAGSDNGSGEVPEWRYTLRPGDTLIGISERYLARPQDWPRVQKHNRIANPRRLVPGSALMIPLAWMRHEPAPATVVAVTGQVRVGLPGSGERTLKSGEQLGAGVSLATAPNSSATLRFADGSVMIVQPSTRLELDTVSVYAGGGMVDTRLRLQQGRVEVGANPARTQSSRLQVITPSAVAAVRGTRFRVAADEQVTHEETLEGEVGLSAAGQLVRVPEGQGTLAEAGKPPSPPVALLQAPDVKALPSRLDALPMRFDLPGQPGALSWLGQIAADETFEAILLEHASETPRLSFADLPDGRYVLRVRAADGQGLQGHDAVHAFELDARPFAPLLTGPGTRVRTARPELKWSEVVGASQYQVEVARDPAFSDKLMSERVSATRLVPASDLPAGTYHWRVASVDNTEQGPFSPSQPLTYDPIPGPPELNQSAPQFLEKALKIDLPAPPAGLRYELVLARDAERKQPVWQGVSRDGQLNASPVEPARYFLSARLVEADGTAGPYATRVIEAPPQRFRWEMLLLLLPLLAL